MKLYVVTHKKTELPDNECYVPVVVGDHSIDYENGVHDNTGDNISDKNKNYCELTALYWMWKNIKEDGYYGLCHYRRFFFNEYSVNKKPFSSKKAEKILKNSDIILPFPVRFNKTVKEQIIETSISEENFNKIREVIEKLYPDYLAVYDEVMLQQYISCYNMFITSKKHMDSYCQWLFDILFELEKVVDITNATPYEQRILGFVSERLVNVWVRKNKLKYHYMSIGDGFNTGGYDYFCHQQDKTAEFDHNFEKEKNFARRIKRLKYNGIEYINNKLKS